MTRQLRKTNKILIGILYFLNIAFVITAYLVSYFNENKMGMRRQMVYFNREWEATYPIPLFKNLIIGFLILLTIYTLYKLIKVIKIKNYKVLVGSIFRLAITIFTLYFIFTSNKSLNRAYYLVSLSLFIGNIFSALIEVNTKLDE